MKIRGVFLAISIILGFTVGYSLHHFLHNSVYLTESAIVLPENPYYLLEDINEEVLYKTLKHYNFPNPAIITAQAVLESGGFKSRLCLENNNLFGLYNSNTLSYFKFDSWISCVFAYRKFILNRYNPEEDYYYFLDRINYAEDPEYIKKLKVLESKILRKYETTEEVLTK